MRIRPFVDDDHDAVLDVWLRASEVGHPYLDREWLDQERRQISERWLPIADTSVAELEGRVVGFLSLVGDDVGALFVDPDHHRAGIGRALMDDAIARRGALELEVLEANDVARAFYAGYGFVEVGRVEAGATGRPELRLRYEPPPGPAGV